VARAEYEKILKHKYWRSLETELHNSARTNPERSIVLSYDDTEAMGFPRTNRPIKNMANDKVYMVPLNLTNHGTRENIYAYDLKHKWKHNGDRMCTVPIPDQEQAGRGGHNGREGPKKSSQVIFAGCNAALNKNNTIFAYCSVGDEGLVRRGATSVWASWPHNGNDAVHFVHNNIAGNFNSITPAELFLTHGGPRKHVHSLLLWNVNIAGRKDTSEASTR